MKTHLNSNINHESSQTPSQSKGAETEQPSLDPPVSISSRPQLQRGLEPTTSQRLAAEDSIASQNLDQWQDSVKSLCPERRVSGEEQNQPPGNVDSAARLELNGEDDERPPANIRVALDMIEGEVNANMPKEMEGGVELIGDEEAPTSHPEQMMSAEWNPEAASFRGIKKTAASSGIQGSSPATLQQHHAVQPSTDDNARQMRPLTPNVSAPSESLQSSNHTAHHGSSAGTQPPPRPHPRSMLPDTSAPSIPLLEATVVREMPVYDATPVEIDARPWWKKHQGWLLLGTGVSIAGLAVAVALGLTLGPDAESAGLALVTTQSAKSFAPSLVPSLRPTLRPSGSVSPSMIPSFTPIFEPSQSGIPSTYPSPQPSTFFIPSSTPSKSLRPTASSAPSQNPSLSSAPSSPPSFSAHPSPQPSTSFIPSSTPSKSFRPTISFAPSQYPSPLPSSQPTRTKLHIIQQFFPGGTSDDLRCIDLRAGDTENGNDVWYFPCHNTPGQYWYRDSFSDYIRSSIDTNKCLVGSAGSTKKGTEMMIYDCFDDDDEAKWDIYADGSIRPRKNELLCLQPSSKVDGSGEGVGFQLVLDDCRDGYKEFVWVKIEVTERPSLQPSTSESPSYAPSESHHPSISSVPSEIPSLNPTSWPSASLVPTSYWHSFSYKGPGDIIYGDDQTEDIFGYAAKLTSNGKYLAVGSVLNVGDGPGYVKVYEFVEDTSAFNQIGRTIHGEIAGDWFGGSIAFDEQAKFLAVGAPAKGNDGAGYVKMYQWDPDASDYKQIGKTLAGDASNDSFGSTVALAGDGKTVIIGAEGQERTGQVKIFSLDDDSSNYYQVGQSITGEGVNDYFGNSCSLASDANMLAIGAYQGGSHPGYVKIYAWDEESSQFELFEKINGDAGYDEFGWSMALSSNGKRLAAGGTDSNGLGYVKMFELGNNSSKFEPLGETLYGDADLGESFGRSISLSQDGNTLAVADPWSDVNGFDSGQVTVYAWDENTGSFVELGISNDTFKGAAGDWFGYSVTLNQDGSWLVVGAPGSGPGYAKVFTRPSVPGDPSSLSLASREPI